MRSFVVGLRPVALLVALAACEPEIVPPTPGDVCLPLVEGEKPELCDAEYCVPRTTSVTRSGAHAGSFQRTAACPNAEALMESGAQIENYVMSYEYEEPASSTSITLRFNGKLCEAGLSSENLRKFITFAGFSAPLRRGAVSRQLAPESIPVLNYANGRLHVRFDATLSSVHSGTEEFACFNSSGHVPTVSSCACTYGGESYEYKFDIDAPMGELGT